MNMPEIDRLTDIGLAQIRRVHALAAGGDEYADMAAVALAEHATTMRLLGKQLHGPASAGAA